MIDASVHKRAVVAYDEYGTVVIGDKATKPLNALEVQVVCRLVEQKKVRVT